MSLLFTNIKSSEGLDRRLNGLQWSKSFFSATSRLGNLRTHVNYTGTQLPCLKNRDNISHIRLWRESKGIRPVTNSPQCLTGDRLSATVFKELLFLKYNGEHGNYRARYEGLVLCKEGSLAEYHKKMATTRHYLKMYFWFLTRWRWKVLLMNSNPANSTPIHLFSLPEPPRLFSRHSCCFNLFPWQPRLSILYPHMASPTKFSSLHQHCSPTSQLPFLLLACFLWMPGTPHPNL